MTKLIIKNDTTPATPASGTTAVYVDSTTKLLVSKDDSGTETAYGAGGGGGSGDLVGPASSVDSNVAMFDGVTGKLLKDSGLTLSGSNTGDQTTIAFANVAGGLQHGSGNVTTSEESAPTSGQILIASGSSNAAWADNVADGINSATTAVDTSAATAPTSGQVLTATSGTTATWQAPSGGTTDIVFSSSSASTVPLTLQGSASQTANLFNIEDSAATSLLSVDSGGVIRLPNRTNATDGTSIAAVGSITNHGITLYGGTGNNSGIRFGAGTSAYMQLSANGLLISGTGAYGVRSGYDGSSTSPAYTFDNDRTTGMFRNGSNNLGFTVDAVQCLNFTTTAMVTNLVFRPGQFATGSLPAAASFEGYIAYDTTTQTMKWSNGTSWATI